MIVTGETQSRLSELRKYGLGSDITTKYIGGGSMTKNGVDFSAIEYIEVDPSLRGTGDNGVRGYGLGVDDVRGVNTAIQLSTIVYYIDGIKYIDDVINNITRFEFTAIGTGTTENPSPNFIHAPIYKDTKKENIISRPKIQDGVFIVRQEVSAFEKNYKLQHVNNLVELTTYLGGSYYNIVNNT